MKKLDNELNNYGFSNPDGRITNVSENKIFFSNEKANFIKENNTLNLQEQVKVEEKVSTNEGSQSQSTGFQELKANFVAISNLLATSIVGVAGAAVIVVATAALIITSMFNINMYACSCDSLTFYIQREDISSESDKLMVRLYNDQMSNRWELGSEPFIEFSELDPDTSYTFEIYDYETEEILYTQEFKTAPMDYYSVGCEFWMEEEGVLSVYVYIDMFDMEEDSSYIYTLSLYNSLGEEIVTEDIIVEPSEPIEEGNYYSFEINENEYYYIGIRYNRDDYLIGNIQSYYYSPREFADGDGYDDGNGY